MNTFLSAIYRYPVKSAAGMRVARAVVEPRGLAGDRRWMLVDEDGVFLTQRQHPRMALIRVHEHEDGLRFEAPGPPPLDVARPDVLAQRRPARVWESTLDVMEADAAAHAWLSAFLGFACRLVYQPDDSIRPVDPDYGQAGDHVSLADGYPLLLLSEASLADLNARLEKHAEMLRFRPNVVVAGCDAFAEDTWTRVQIGPVVFRVAKPCKRCSITTVDPATGEVGKEPLRTLATYRGWNGGVYFGQNLIPEGAGVLEEGNAVRVLD